MDRQCGAAVEVFAGPGASKVHEEAQLIVNIELGVSGDAEAHLVTFPLLVLLTSQAVEGGAPLVLMEASIVVRVID